MISTHLPASRVRPFRSLLIAMVALVSLACGSSGPPKAKVYGKVSYLGKPVIKGTISFTSVDPEGRNATGLIDPDGNYSLQTEDPGDGAQIGGYVVTISAHDEPILDYIPKTPVPPKLLVPAKYENPATSGLLRTVSKGGNSINFDLTD